MTIVSSPEQYLEAGLEVLVVEYVTGTNGVAGALRLAYDQDHHPARAA